MTKITRFEDLDCWKASRLLVREVYKVTRQGEVSRDFGFRNQIQRAAVSVMSNIAEGFESRTQNTFVDFLGHAKASAGEVRSQCYVALDLEYVGEDEFKRLVELSENCSRQIYGLIKYIRSGPNRHRISEDGVPYLA